MHVIAAVPSAMVMSQADRVGIIGDRALNRLLTIVRRLVGSQWVSQPSNLNLVPARSSSNMLLQLRKASGWFSGSRLLVGCVF